MKKGIAFSGGGYRATLFALGSLWRLNDEGMLPTFDTITSVSGGSIATGLLALNWDKLTFSNRQTSGKLAVATNFDEWVAQPLIAFCNHSIDISSTLKGLVTPNKTVGDYLREKYDELLYSHRSLRDIDQSSSAPQFVFYGTNYDTGASVRICKEYFRDYRIGIAYDHDLSLAQAVSISSCFPPFFAPIELAGEHWRWESLGPMSDLCDRPELKKKLVLCDGGLYDNLGIEMLWKIGDRKEYSHVYVVDSGAPFKAPYQYSDNLLGKALKLIKWRNNWVSQYARMTDIMINQQRALRKRWLINNYIENAYQGKYWGIDTEIEKYDVIDILATTTPANRSLESLPTQLRPFDKHTVESLINWSYALADAALRAENPDIKKGTLPF